MAALSCPHTGLGPMHNICAYATDNCVISVASARGYPQISVVYDPGYRSGDILWDIAAVISWAIYHGYLRISWVNSLKTQ